MKKQERKIVRAERDDVISAVENAAPDLENMSERMRAISQIWDTVSQADNPNGLHSLANRAWTASDRHRYHWPPNAAGIG